MTAESWEALRSRVITLAGQRDAAIEEAAVAWAGFARRQGWGVEDLALLWEGVTEDMVRRYARGRTGEPRALRDEILAVLTAVRARVLRRLAEAS